MTTFVDPKAKVEIKFGMTAAEKDAGDNSVWVRAKMNLCTEAAVQRDLLMMKVDAADDMRPGALAFHFGVTAQKLALLKHNIVRWSGPLFVDEEGRPVVCRPEMVDQLDPIECAWWIDLVAARIDQLNRKRVELAPSPNGNQAPDPN